jgi:hypothetical protein
MSVKLPKPEESGLEAAFRQQLMELRQRVPEIPPWERNHEFIPGRKKQLDFAWPAIRFGIEIDGGAHRTKQRFHGDREKMALALLAEWRVLPVTGLHVKSLQGISWAETLLLRFLRARRYPTPAHREPISDAEAGLIEVAP